ncbi:MAG TPA: signal peptidase I [Allosphingosinicella sp.]|nr:signal peptidase I [Allosphingosinicella sp.]
MDEIPPSQPPVPTPEPPAPAAAAPTPEPPAPAAAAPAPEPPAPAAGAAAPAAQKPAKAKKEKKEETWWGTLRFLLYLFVGAVLIRTFLFAPFSIPSGSMMPNLMIGDYLFVAKWPYGYSRYSFPFAPIGFDGRLLGGVPERGDVIVFRHPGPDNEDYVKRVIGLPGDTIAVRGGVVNLNGQDLPRQAVEPFDMLVSPNSECRRVRGVARQETLTRQQAGADGRQHCIYTRFRETLPGGRSYEVLDQTAESEGDTFGPITVPEGQLFVMGDNRDDSMDSRFPIERRGVGLLPIDNVLGRALIGFWSTDGSAQWLLPWTWFTAARWSRIFETY